MDKWNAYRLGEIDSEPCTFDAELSGPEHQQQFLINNLLTPQRLELKRGARVMFTVNSSDGRLVNGQTGIVTEFAYGSILVESEGRVIAVEPFSWPYDKDDDGMPIMREHEQGTPRIRKSRDVGKVWPLIPSPVSADSRRVRGKPWVRATRTVAACSRALGRCNIGLPRASVSFGMCEPQLGACQPRLGRCEPGVATCQPSIGTYEFTLAPCQLPLGRVSAGAWVRAR